MYLVWATCACMTARFSGSTWNKKVSFFAWRNQIIVVFCVFGLNRPNALSAQAPRSGAKERLIVTKHNLDLMNVTNYS